MTNFHQPLSPEDLSPGRGCKAFSEFCWLKMRQTASFNNEWNMNGGIFIFTNESIVKRNGVSFAVCEKWYSAVSERSFLVP